MKKILFVMVVMVVVGSNTSYGDGNAYPVWQQMLNEANNRVSRIEDNYDFYFMDSGYSSALNSAKADRDKILNMPEEQKKQIQKQADAAHAKAVEEARIAKEKAMEEERIAKEKAEKDKKEADEIAKEYAPSMKKYPVWGEWLSKNLANRNFLEVHRLIEMSDTEKQGIQDDSDRQEAARIAKAKKYEEDRRNYPFWAIVLDDARNKFTTANDNYNKMRPSGLIHIAMARMKAGASRDNLRTFYETVENMSDAQKQNMQDAAKKFAEVSIAEKNKYPEWYKWFKNAVEKNDYNEIIRFANMTDDQKQKEQNRVDDAAAKVKKDAELALQAAKKFAEVSTAEKSKYPEWYKWFKNAVEKNDYNEMIRFANMTEDQKQKDQKRVDDAAAKVKKNAELALQAANRFAEVSTAEKNKYPQWYRWFKNAVEKHDSNEMIRFANMPDDIKQKQ